MQKEASKGISLSVPMAFAARDCHRKGEIYSLFLLSGEEEKEFYSKLEELQGSYLGKDIVFEKIDTMIREGSKREWFHMDSQYAALMNEEAAYQKALASFFIGKKTVESNIRWSVPLSYMVGEAHVGEIHGKVHAVYEENDRYYAVIFCRKSDYSLKAKKFCNKPENAPELIGAYLGLREKYGDDIRIILAHERPRKKNCGAYFEEAQVLRISFKGVPKEQLIERMVRVLTENPAACNCTTCNYSAMCSGMNLPKHKPVEDIPVKKREPRFTADQQKLVSFTDGACAVYAVPGAGKTTSLVYRLKTLLDAGVDPKNILFVTFTNKACEEIRQRVKNLLNTDFEEDLPDIFTYNGLGWQILRDNRGIVGDLKLLTSLDEKLLLIECIDELKKGRPELLEGFNFNLIEGRFGLLSELLGSFRKLNSDDTNKEETIKLQENGRLESFLALKELLADKISEGSYITFDEQITRACRLFTEHPEVLQQYGKRWQYIMADEFQDSSTDNVELLYALANAGKRNLVVVGDADQSIYEWRDASPEHLINFQEAYPEARMIQMSDNFRSVSNILGAANKLISKNLKRVKLEMVAHKESAFKPYRVINTKIEDIMQILPVLLEKKYRYGDIAILSRNNQVLEKAKAVLEANNIESVSPTDYLIRDTFFVLFKDILDMYFDGFTDKTELSFYRYLLSCGIKPPAKQENGETLYKNLIVHHGITPVCTNDMDSAIAYESLNLDIADNELYCAMRRLYLLFLYIEEYSSYPMEVLRRVQSMFDADPEMPSIAELEGVIDFQNITSVKDLREYLSVMVEFSDDRKIEHSPSPDKVNLMTAHGSKGKEFLAVIILQSEDFGGKNDSEEERRLLYVAMTRAEKALFVLESIGKESRMLKDLEKEMNIMQLA